MKVAFIGHRKIEYSQELKNRLTNTIEQLIINESADVFMFGSVSEFNDLCYEVVTELKARYSHIKRIRVRAEYEYIDSSYTEFLLTLYEDTFYPTMVHGAGKLSYIKRNQVMVDMCDTLIVYCNEKYVPHTRTNSGTKIAVEYAKKKNKRQINLFE